MKHTKILNSSQKVFGVYISDLIPLAVVWIILSSLSPNSFKGVELIGISITFGVTFYMRSKYRKGYIVDSLVNIFIKIFCGGIYVRKYKNNWDIIKKLD